MDSAMMKVTSNTQNRHKLWPEQLLQCQCCLMAFKGVRRCSVGCFLFAAHLSTSMTEPSRFEQSDGHQGYNDSCWGCCSRCSSSVPVQQLGAVELQGCQVKRLQAAEEKEPPNLLLAQTAIWSWSACPDAQEQNQRLCELLQEQPQKQQQEQEQQWDKSLV